MVPALALAPCGSSAAEVGAPFSLSLVASGGTSSYTYIQNGSFPAGLSLSPAGTISGTPADGTDSTTPYNISVIVSDGLNFASTSCSITIASFLVTPTCPSTALDQEVGVAFSATLGPAGGASPLTYTITGGSLPTSLSINPSTGSIGGIPTHAGFFAFQIQVTDGLGQTKTSPACTITGTNTIGYADLRIDAARPSPN